MPVIPIPFILSGNGPVDSLFGTVGLWVLLLLVIVIISAAYALLKGEISLPRMNVTGRNIITALLIAVAGGVAFIVYPLLLLPLLVAVLVVLAFLEVKSMDKDLDSGAWNRYPGPATYDTGFVNAGFRVGDEPVQNVKPVRPEKPGPASDTGEQKKAVERRASYEDTRKQDYAQALRAREQDRLEHIHALRADRSPEYPLEAQKFQREFGKNVQCDVCGRWDGGLSVHRNRTYCARCLAEERGPGT